jgi:hypothetical protein
MSSCSTSLGSRSRRLVVGVARLVATALLVVIVAIAIVKAAVIIVMVKVVTKHLHATSCACLLAQLEGVYPISTDTSKLSSAIT